MKKLTEDCQRKGLSNFTKKPKYFIKEAKVLLNKIILNNLRLKKQIKMLLTRVQHFLSRKSSIFYDNRKIIVVTRDPRSVFASMKEESLWISWI